jgi:hypothetical protein
MDWENIFGTIAGFAFMLFLVLFGIFCVAFFLYAMPYMLVTGTSCAPMPWAPCQ